MYGSSVRGKNVVEYKSRSALFFWEETTNVFTGNGFGCSALICELGTFWGVTLEDIDDLSPRFLGYIHGQAELGKLPTLKEFAEKNKK